MSPDLVAAIRDAIDREPLPSIHRLDCHCSPRDDQDCLKLRELIAALVASWVGPLVTSADTLLGAVYQGVRIGVPVKAAPLDAIFAAERTMHAALAALPWRKEPVHE